MGKEGGGSGVNVVVLMGLMGKDFKQRICLTRLGEDEFWNKEYLGPHMHGKGGGGQWLYPAWARSREETLASSYEHCRVPGYMVCTTK